MMPGHTALPTGFGTDSDDGTRSGVAPNELTSLTDRDKVAETPWHKYVAAQLEVVANQVLPIGIPVQVGTGPCGL